MFKPKPVNMGPRWELVDTDTGQPRRRLGRGVPVADLVPPRATFPGWEPLQPPSSPFIRGEAFEQAVQRLSALMEPLNHPPLDGTVTVASTEAEHRASDWWNSEPIYFTEDGAPLPAEEVPL